MSNNSINKELILREQLAIQRTHMANQTTLLSFIRTALYFFVAGLSIKSFFKMEKSISIEIFFFSISVLIFMLGWYNFYTNFKKIQKSKKHIGNYQDEYLVEH